MLALCFSHQLVNKAYGGKVGNADYGFIFGADKIEFRKSERLPEEFRRLVEKHKGKEETLRWNLLQSHNDEV